MSTPHEDAASEFDDLLSFDGDDEAGAGVIPEEREMFRIPSGKYKGLELPRMIGVKPDYIAQVEALKTQIEQDPEFRRHASSIAWTYAEMRREAEKKGKELSDLKLRLAAVMLLLIDQFEVEGQTSMTLASGDKVRWNPEPHLMVTDKEEFRQWCLKNDLERQMFLPWGTANKMVKEMILNAGTGAQPPGTECYMRPKVTFTKGDK